MYSINNKKKNKGKLIDKAELIDIDGFLMASKRKIFKINGCDIREINVVDKDLATPIASRKVTKIYEKLIARLTELLIDDDDSGDSYREVLNHIEKFRLEIKIKYRKFLKQKELEKMSKQLIALKKEAQSKLIEIQNSYLEQMNNTNNRRR